MHKGSNKSQNQPTKVDAAWTSSQQVANVACGYKHTLVALANGTAWSCGTGRHGELGLGMTKLALF